MPSVDPPVRTGISSDLGRNDSNNQARDLTCWLKRHCCTYATCSICRRVQTTKGPTAWCLGLVGKRPYFGHGEPRSEFSTQPQVLSRIGLHVTPPGQALGLASGNPPMLASCVLDLTLSVYDAGLGTVTSTKSYADKAFLEQPQPKDHRACTCWTQAGKVHSSSD